MPNLVRTSAQYYEGRKPTLHALFLVSNTVVTFFCQYHQILQKVAMLLEKSDNSVTFQTLKRQYC